MLHREASQFGMRRRHVNALAINTVSPFAHVKVSVALQDSTVVVVLLSEDFARAGISVHDPPWTPLFMPFRNGRKLRPVHHAAKPICAPAQTNVPFVTPYAVVVGVRDPVHAILAHALGRRGLRPRAPMTIPFARAGIIIIWLGVGRIAMSGQSSAHIFCENRIGEDDEEQAGGAPHGTRPCHNHIMQDPGAEPRSNCA